MIIANDYHQKLPVVLASASATRAAILKGAGVGFSIHAAQIDEDSVKHSMHSANRSALDTAQALSDLKASQVSLGHPIQHTCHCRNFASAFLNVIQLFK